MTRYSDITQLDSVWLETLEYVRDKLRTMRTAGMLEGITSNDHIEIRKLPFVLENEKSNGCGMLVCPAPEQRSDQLTTNTNQGVRLGILVTGWCVTDRNLYDVGRFLRWRGQFWNPANGLNVSRYVLASTSVYAELEAGPIFDPGPWSEGIDQTSMMIRVLTRAALA